MSYSEAIELLEQAQDSMREAAGHIQDAMGVIDNSTTRERLRGYILGHLEPLIDREHDWLTRSTSLQDIIREVQENSLTSEEEE